MGKVSNVIITWVVRVLLFLLVASFALWGIGDVFRGNVGGNYAAKIDGKVISLQDYQSAVNHAKTNMQRMLGEGYSPAMLKSLNIERQVLSNLLNDAVLHKEAARFGIRITDDEILDEIRNTPAFLGADGEFSKDAFEIALRSAGITQAQYAGQLKQEKARQLLTETLMLVDLYPTGLPALMEKAALEKRTVELWRFPVDRSSSKLTPTDDELKTFYDANKQRFSEPETRTLVVLTIDADKIMKSTTVTPEELRQAYENQKDSFMLPEIRTVEQLLYRSEADAQKAEALAKDGKSFAAIAKEVPPLNKKLSLGNITKKQALDDAADAIFDVSEGESTQAIQSPLGWHLFHVSAIDSARPATFEDVKEELAVQVQQTAAENALYGQLETVEDMLSRSTPLVDVANELKLRTQTIGPVTHTGELLESGQPSELPPIKGLLEQAFALGENESTSAIRGDDGAYYIVSAATITPARIKELSEVRGQVEAGWRLNTLQSKLQAELRKADPEQSTVFKELGGQLQVKTITRGQKGLPSSLVLDAFARASGASTFPHPMKNGDIALAIVREIHHASEAQIKRNGKTEEMENELRVAYSNDLYDLYMKSLNDRYEVDINPSLFSKKSNEQ